MNLIKMQIPLDRIYSDVFLCKVSLATRSLRFLCVASVTHFLIMEVYCAKLWNVNAMVLD